MIENEEVVSSLPAIVFGVVLSVVLMISVIGCQKDTSIQHAEGTLKHNYKPKQGYVPDEESAIKIAVAIWTPIYGKKQIEGEKPYNAVLKEGVWYVTGSLPKGWLGGVAEAEIAKDDGRIIRISHGE